MLGAARRAIDADPRPNRVYLTGSVSADLDREVYEGTGRLIRLPMFPMTVRELIGDASGATFFDRLAAGDTLRAPPSTPNLREYVDLALQGGFPFIALRLDGRARRLALEGYLESLLTHDVEQREGDRGRRVDRSRLRSYFEAYALNSAGVADHKAIYDGAQISRTTAVAYEGMLVGSSSSIRSRLGSRIG